ncbi:hypothetical protein SDC9_125215 [bioreactor metagenome]|uniref:Uncharacterized protein n=1 Tax=bioreactor metagenome TaxID=1076179 RepID=A0A645CMU1_9ZZZZ
MLEKCRHVLMTHGDQLVEARIQVRAHGRDSQQCRGNQRQHDDGLAPRDQPACRGCNKPVQPAGGFAQSH